MWCSVKSYWLLVALCFAPLLLFSSIASAQNKVWIKEISDAMECEERDDYAGALQHYDRAMEIEPHSCHFVRAICYSHLGKHKEAIEDLNQALKKDPKMALAYARRGQEYNILGKRKQAIKDLSRALRIMDAEKEKTAALTAKLQKQGVMQGDVMRVIHISVYQARADIYQKEKMFHEALADRWSVVKRRRPQELAEDYAQLTLAYSDIEDTKKALKYQDKTKALMQREQEP